MKKGLKKNSILDDGHTSDLFSQDTFTLPSLLATPKRKIVKKSKKTPSSKAARSKQRSKLKSKLTTKAKLPAADKISTTETIASERDANREKEQEQEQDSVLDPKTVTIITVNEKISKRLAQHLWQELSPNVIKSLQDLILNVYIEPVVIQTSKSDKVRDRLRELLQELIVELSKKLLNVKLPVLKNPNFLNLEMVSNKKLYMEAVLSSNLKQIEILERELIKFERIYDSDLAYFNNLTKAIAKDDLVKDLNTEENLEYQLVNLKELKPRDQDDQFDQLLMKLNRHLTSIDNNIKELVSLNDKVEIVNELLQLI